jgi:molybdenum cofactor guanylyltransferase
MIQLSGIILSGGQSSRMGSDKAFIEFQGKSLIEYPINLLQQFCNEIIISANSQEYQRFGFKLIHDNFPGCGPIGGVFSSLKHSSNDWNLVLGCDTPYISGDVLTRLIGYIDNYNCIISIHYNLKEPLVALYNKNSLSVFLEHIKEKDYSMHSLLKNLNCRYVDVSDVVDNNPLLFSNFNSLADIT